MISKFDNGRLLVPKVLVSGGSDSALKPRRGNSAGSSNAEFHAVVDVYDMLADEPFKTRRRGRDWRSLGPNDWPDAVHFEFLKHHDGIGVELHIESGKTKFLAEKLSPFHGAQLFPDATLQWDPTWSRNRGRLLAKFGKDEAPERVAEAMKALIAMLMPLVQKEIQARGMCAGSISTLQAGAVSSDADSLD